MEAVQLVGVTRYALAQSGTVPAIVAEAWQTQALAVAVGGHLATYGPLVVQAEARQLSEAGDRPGDTLQQEALCAGGVRASRLTLIDDPRSALVELGELLGEVGAALVRVAVSAEEEVLYWQCIEAIDVVDESSDRVTSMLRSLALREREAMT